jgi:putative ABC transport system permease protein
MLQNYFKIAFRNLLKHKVFSIINISGLALGIACCTLLALYIKDEFSYEKHFAAYDRTYRITTTFKNNNEETLNPRTSPPIAMAVRAEFPEVESATRVIPPPEVEQHLIQYKDKVFYEKRGYLVDSTFFDVFDYSFKEGNAQTALLAPSSVVLSAVVAEKLFGNEAALDELLVITSGPSVDTFRVGGVLQPLQHKSHVDADFYMSMNSKGWGEWISGITTWAGQNFGQSFIRLKTDTSPQQTETKLASLLEKHGGQELRAAGMNKTLHLQALDHIHLFSADYIFDLSNKGNITYLYILTSIGAFILLIACINFMNLSTAKASQRAGEVGVRKTMGATRGSLIRQFLGESTIIVVIAAALAVVFTQLALPLFNYVTQKQLSFASTDLFFLAISLLAIALVTGLVAGSYPAFYLSTFEPAVVLKDKRLSGGGRNWLRKSLVVVQFVISITLISSIAIIYSQMNYIHSQSLGFNPEYNVTFPLRTVEAKASYPNFRDRLQSLTGVNTVSGGTSLPSTFFLRDFSLYKQGGSMQDAIHHFVVYIDENYFKTLGIKLLEGRDFTFERDSSTYKNELSRVIVNQSSLKQLGLNQEEAIGTFIMTDWEGITKRHEIIGVVEDFHHASLHEKISPLLFQIPAGLNDFLFATVSINAANYNDFTEQAAKLWKELNPNTPFENTLMIQHVQKQYEADDRMAMIITSFTTIALIISCMGLYGLSIYVAERKTKEIGIRKVMGASVANIIKMMTADFIKLIAIAFVIAVPVSYYFMNEWLETFSFHVEMSVWIFLMAGAASFLVAWLTVGFESVKAAVSNPVNSLRNE